MLLTASNDERNLFWLKKIKTFALSHHCSHQPVSQALQACYPFSAARCTLTGCITLFLATPWENLSPGLEGNSSKWIANYAGSALWEHSHLSTAKQRHPWLLFCFVSLQDWWSNAALHLPPKSDVKAGNDITPDLTAFKPEKKGRKRICFATSNVESSI